MNGRIYDPRLGRFLQADPFVQDPKNSQFLNRYTYALNNPLSYTDPSGYFLKELALFVAAVVRVVYAWEDPSAWVYLAVSAKNLFNATGSQQSGLPTGAVAGSFSSGSTTATNINTGGVWNAATQASGDSSGGVIEATIGSTGSDATGWKFANGAKMAGFAYTVAATTSAIPARDTVEESRQLTYEEYLAEIKAAGVSVSKLSRSERKLIKSLVANPDVISKATRIFDEAVVTGSGSQMLRIYEGKNGNLMIDTVQGQPCTNGSSTCISIPPPKNLNHVLDWHPHPNGSSLPSSSDYINSARNGGVLGVIWYRSGNSYKTIFYKGVCTGGDQC